MMSSTDDQHTYSYPSRGLNQQLASAGVGNNVVVRFVPKNGSGSSRNEIEDRTSGDYQFVPSIKAGDMRKYQT